MIAKLSAWKHEQEHRDELRQPDEPQRERTARDFVDPPANGDRLHQRRNPVKKDRAEVDGEITLMIVADGVSARRSTCLWHRRHQHPLRLGVDRKASRESRNASNMFILCWRGEVMA